MQIVNCLEVNAAEELNWALQALPVVEFWEGLELLIFLIHVILKCSPNHYVPLLHVLYNKVSNIYICGVELGGCFLTQSKIML